MGGGGLEYIRSKFQPICHVSHSSLTAIHLAATAAAAATISLLLLSIFQGSTMLIFKLILIILASRFKLL